MLNGRKIVALCTSRIYDPPTHGFIKRINESLKERSATLLIYAINSEFYWQEDELTPEIAVYDIMPFDIIDAVIVMSEKIKSETVSTHIISESQKHNLPVIVIDGGKEDTININFDYKTGFEQIVRHVFEEHDIKNPHIMAGFKDNPFSEDRIDVFKKVVEEKGFTFNDSMISYGEFWALPARAATEKLIESGNIPDAIICANDIMAINVCDVLISSGYRVPEDVIVTGFDGYEEVYLTTPKISTVSCDTMILADATINTVISVLATGTAESIFITPTLIPNESCGCPSHTIQGEMLLSRLNDSFYRYQDDIRIYHDVATKMQTSADMDEMVLRMVNSKITDLYCAVDSKCFDFSENFLTTNNTFKKDHLEVVFDTNFAKYYSNTGDIKASLALCKKERINNLFEGGYPLIYNVLDYMGKPIGYVCYFFKDYDITMYTKTASISNALSLGIGGYVDSKYQEKLSEQIAEMYKKDNLTGLYNRIGFKEVFTNIINDADNTNSKITLIMSDLDGLKYINDTFGHAEGDNAIAVLASALKSSCPEHAICSRFGGDELFSVIIGEVDSSDIISKIDSYLDNYNKQSGLKYKVRSSSGYFTTTLTDKFNFNEALKLADSAMYKIKKSRK